MNYIEKNKEAWEEAFDNRTDGWGENVVQNLRGASDCYIQPALKAELDKLELSGKHIAQFCCNNGRELLSICKHYNAVGTGFDIAENLISQGTRHAQELQLPCTFIAENILDIPHAFDEAFDAVLFTIGAITWFQDLKSLFQVVSRCLKPEGILLIHDFHPVMNMLPLSSEEGYCKDEVHLMEHTYFTNEPWIENNGMGYISGEYASKTFTSFSHSVSDIVNSTITNDMDIRLLREYDYDIGLSDAYDYKGLPLSMLLMAVKRK